MAPSHHTSRTSFTHTVLFALAAGLTIAGPAAADNRQQPARRPNVVYLLADQWRAQAMGYAGDPNARTPHLDRLAADGVVLATAVSHCPVCSPYRASLMTGLYPVHHGVILNDVRLNPDSASLAKSFKQAGYQTAYIGKWHLDGGDRSLWTPPDRRQRFDFWRSCECTHEYNRSLYYADTDKKLYWKGYDALAQTEEAQAYIRGHRQNPFLLVLSWGTPHNPYGTAPQQYRDRFKPEALRLRPNVPAQSATAARRDLAGYYAHCAALDDYVGRIEATLKECGLADDTIVVFTADHGDMLGSQGEVRKQRPWDESIRVPFLVHWPNGLGTTGRKLSAPFNTPDIMPTLLGLCGIALPGAVDGDDRSQWLRGNEPDRDRPALISCVTVFGEWKENQGGREYRGLRTMRYTYVRTLHGPWLLYDNQEDPYQQRNLVDVAEYAKLQAKLDGQLTAELKRAKDDFCPGSEYMEKWGYGKKSSGAATPKR